MTPFDELTLAELEEMQTDCLGGKSIQDADSMQLAGAVMYMTHRRADESINWDAFRKTTRMVDIKAFSELMNDEESDPTNGAMS